MERRERGERGGKSIKRRLQGRSTRKEEAKEGGAASDTRKEGEEEREENREGKR